MKRIYKNEYYNDSMNRNVIDILSGLNISNGVYLDIGCGYGAINKKVTQELNFEYVGIDEDIDSINYLKKDGTEAYHHFFCDYEEDYKYLKTILKDRLLCSISLLDMIEHVIEPAGLIHLFYRLALEYNVPLILSVPNISHKDIAFKLLEGRFEYTDAGLLDRTQLSFFSEDRLNLLMKTSGFIEIARKDFCMEKSDQHFPEDDTLLSQGTLVYTYLSHLKSLFDPNFNVNQFVRAYLPLNKSIVNIEKKLEKRPFLSVITRTQGRRPEALREVLLCLTAQKFTDFEILIIGHKLTSENQHEIERIIDDTPEWLREKVNFIKIDYGTRTTPLNVGFDIANGKYISILDDDDIVFDNWSETFYQLAINNSGAILHAYSVGQDWNALTTNLGTNFLRAKGSPKKTYCKNFNFLSEINVNYCPTMSLAYPAYAFHKLNIRFDESLTTTEDWDFLLRTASICGVADAPIVTSIYRLWLNSESSQTIHSKDEWNKNHLIIQEKINKIPLLLPTGYSNKILNLSYPWKDCNNVTGKLTADNIFEYSMSRRYRIILGIRMLLPIRVYNLLRRIKRKLFN